MQRRARAPERAAKPWAAVVVAVLAAGVGGGIIFATRGEPERPTATASASSAGAATEAPGEPREPRAAEKQPTPAPSVGADAPLRGSSEDFERLAEACMAESDPRTETQIAEEAAEKVK